MTRILVLGGLLALLISGCGTPLCIGGVGDCGYNPATTPAKGTGSPTRGGTMGTNGATGGSDFTISSVMPNVSSRQYVQLIAFRGRATITWKTTFPSENFGNVDQDLKYHAPVINVSTQLVKIQATDADGKVSNEIPIQVTQ